MLHTEEYEMIKNAALYFESNAHCKVPPSATTMNLIFSICLPRPIYPLLSIPV
jgi:hypothetical protein